MIRKARAVWRGTDRDGGGKASTESGALAETPYSFRTRFENEKGTNPEQLIAAAHAECFSMTLAGEDEATTEIDVAAAVTIEPEGERFCISRSSLTLQAQVPNLDEATFARIVGEAKKNCPMSKVLKAEIKVEANLIPA
jgi:lipoyl-dependent peroxiredoxin